MTDILLDFVRAMGKTSTGRVHQLCEDLETHLVKTNLAIDCALDAFGVIALRSKDEALTEYANKAIRDVRSVLR